MPFLYSDGAASSDLEVSCLSWNKLFYPSKIHNNMVFEGRVLISLEKRHRVCNSGVDKNHLSETDTMFILLSLPPFLLTV